MPVVSGIGEQIRGKMPINYALDLLIESLLRGGDPKFQIIRNHIALDKAAAFCISRPTCIKEKQKKVYVEVVQRTVLCYFDHTIRFSLENTRFMQRFILR